MSSETTQTLVIGIDSATWTVIDPLLADGQLPNIGRLVNDGVRGTIKSTTPPITPAAWTSISTGVDPGTHGVFGFFDQNPTTYDIHPVSNTTGKFPSVWDICHKEDYDVGVINYPAAFPPSDRTSFFISGMPSEVGEGIVYPDSVRPKIEETDFRTTPNIRIEEGDEKFYEEIKSITEAQKELTINMCEDFELDCLISVFMGVDWVQHYLWSNSIRGENAVNRFYKYIDEVIGELIYELDAFDDTLLVSDHGATEIGGEIHLNELLAERGILSQVRQEKLFTSGLAERAWGVGAKLPFTIKKQIDRVVPGTILERVQDAAGEGTLDDVGERIDWENTRTFSYGSMGQLYIHATGTYPDGVIPDEERSDLIDELVSELEALEHPETGEVLIESVQRTDDIYATCPPNGPDLVIIPSEWSYPVRGTFGNPVIDEDTRRQADHDPDGIIVMAGNRFEGSQVDCSVLDVAPTLLYLLDVAVPNHMQGEVLTEAIAESYRSKNDVRFADCNKHSGSSEKRDSEVNDRLRDLGYL